MDVITIPKKLAQKDDLVVVPRKEYEELLELKKIIPVVKPSREEMRIIQRGEREIREGKYVEWATLKRKLAYRHHRLRRKTD